MSNSPSDISSQAKHCEVNDYILKCIVGHEIRDVTEKSVYISIN